jgi:hypothetical protein
MNLKSIGSLLLSLIFVTVILPQDRYETGMKTNLAKMEDCKTANDYLKVANSFERIATAEKDKWLPYYYGALNCVLAGYMDSSNVTKDLYLDKADKYINKADSLAPENSEISTLKGMIAQARMQVDPMNRWQQYGAEANKEFTMAMQQDTLNPRPEYLIGVGLYYTPEQFGGGPAAAKNVLEKSLAKFEKFVPENDLMPHWGKEQVEQYLKMISEAK